MNFGDRQTVEIETRGDFITIRVNGCEIFYANVTQIEYKNMRELIADLVCGKSPIDRELDGLFTELMVRIKNGNLV